MLPSHNLGVAFQRGLDIVAEPRIGDHLTRFSSPRISGNCCLPANLDRNRAAQRIT